MKIGYTRCDIKAGEVMAEVDLCSGRISSKSIRFVPWGKKKLSKEALRLLRRG